MSKLPLTHIASTQKTGKKLFWRLVVAFLGYLLPIVICLKPNAVLGQSANYLTSPAANTYTLTQPAKTSAGIYTKDSILVRTLWTAKSYDAGTYRIEWDGKDDLGNPAPAGDYVAKVLANNVKYTWSGVIGNSSDSNTGSTVHRASYYFMTGMTIVNNTAYYCSGYSEGRPSIAKFVTSQPQKKISIEKNPGTTTSNIDYVASDGKLVYWSGYDAYDPTNTWVFANKIADDTDVTFTGGVQYNQKHGRGYNAISYINQAKATITGLAVQKKGNFLFIARQGLNRLTILNKTTGTAVTNLTVSAPKFLCIDANDNLWMVTDSNKVSKYIVNTNGTLSTPVLTISSVLAPISMAVSPDNNTLAIADGAITSQQVKAFNTTTGAKLWILGTAGGYIPNSLVSNNKFYFNDIRGRMYAAGVSGFFLFIAFQPDGSFWVNDPGNYRVQHYSAQLQYIETIMAMGPSYSTWADKNDNTRVGAEYLEFKIDNSAPLTGKTGWQLVRNWGANISTAYDRTTKFTNVVTLKSGSVSRTFGFLRIMDNYHLVEFKSDNTLRFTGVVRRRCNIDKDGAILTDDLSRYTFKGFDAQNNPIWNTVPESLGNTVMLNDKSPLPKQGFRNTYITSSGKVVFYDYGIELSIRPTVVINTGFHLGAMQKGGKDYLWKTAKGTHLSYKGAYPEPDLYDIGNQVNNNAGSSAMVLNNNIITGYHGEFWKGTQTNMYNHYFDNGLAIGQFGTVGQHNGEQAPAMMAGNALSPQLVKGNNSDEAYLFHGDESFHSGMHKWTISGLTTVKLLNVPIKYPSDKVAAIVAPGTNLMVGLPYDQLLVNNTAGWTMSPETQQTGWSVRTNALVSDKRDNPDVFIVCKSATGTFSVNRDLGNNNKLDYWALNGEISYYLTDQQGVMKQYFDVLDNTGKIIVRISNVWAHSSTPGQTKNTIYGNSKVLVTGLNDSFIAPLMQKLQPLEIRGSKGSVIIKYAGYSVTVPPFDATANVSSPKTMRAYITGGVNPTGRNFGFKDMRFVNTVTPQAITFEPVGIKSLGDAPFNLIASSTNNMPVSFSLVSGPAVIDKNTVTITGEGDVVVNASQLGNSAYKPAPSVKQAFTVAGIEKNTHIAL
ncbi:hypothetical protein GCM10023149_13890 [Mucilaginibacter gynuensis]|uniref:FlgD/Vpr Ig-like domain-containing protein n=1 Tax=Mucilaginibacter gynuensis TaxID=1302236 RepID=A0ABP8G437_9SPHI